MVIHHLFAFPDRLNKGITYISLYQITGKNVEYIIGVFGWICIAMFSFISGFGIYKKNGNKDNNMIIKSTLIKLEKLYLNYWIIIFFFVGASFLMGYRKFEIMEFIDNMVGYTFTYNTEAWYIWLYLILLITVPLSLKVINRDLWSSLFKLAIISIIIRTIIPYIFTDDLWREFRNTVYYKNIHLLKWYSCFLCGMIFAKYSLFEQINKKLINNSIIKSIAIFIGGLYLRARYGYYFDYIFVPMFIVSMINIAKTIRIDSILQYIGKHSTNIWLIHSFFVFQYLQEFTYMPRVSVLVLIWTIILCLVCSNFIMFVQIKINNIIKKNFDN